MNYNDFLNEAKTIQSKKMQIHKDYKEYAFTFSYPPPQSLYKIDESNFDCVELDDEINIYIHIPYCTGKCSYCYFCCYELNKCSVKKSEYVSLLRHEIKLARNKYGKKIVSSIHIGGGTPTRIKPEETMMGNIKGITLKEVKQLKALAVRGAEAEQTVKQQANTIELQKAQITSLERQLRPSIQKRLKEAQELSDLKDENMALEYELNRQKDLMARLMQRVEAALNFLEEKLPEQFRPYVQRARAHIMPEPKQKHRHDRGMSMGGMER